MLASTTMVASDPKRTLSGFDLIYVRVPAASLGRHATGKQLKKDKFTCGR
jgi:hypothetical protein